MTARVMRWHGQLTSQGLPLNQKVAVLDTTVPVISPVAIANRRAPLEVTQDSRFDAASCAPSATLSNALPQDHAQGRAVLRFAR